MGKKKNCLVAHTEAVIKIVKRFFFHFLVYEPFTEDILEYFE